MEYRQPEGREPFPWESLFVFLGLVTFIAVVGWLLYSMHVGNTELSMEREKTYQTCIEKVGDPLLCEVAFDKSRN